MIGQEAVGDTTGLTRDYDNTTFEQEVEQFQEGLSEGRVLPGAPTTAADVIRQREMLKQQAQQQAIRNRNLGLTSDVGRLDATQTPTSAIPLSPADVATRDELDRQRQMSTSATDSRLADPRLSDPRFTDPRLSDPRFNARLSDPRLSDPRFNDPRFIDPRLSDPDAAVPDVPMFDPGPGTPVPSSPIDTDPLVTDPRIKHPDFVEPDVPLFDPGPGTPTPSTPIPGLPDFDAESVQRQLQARRLAQGGLVYNPTTRMYERATPGQMGTVPENLVLPGATFPQQNTRIGSNVTAAPPAAMQPRMPTRRARTTAGMIGAGNTAGSNTAGSNISVGDTGANAGGATAGSSGAGAGGATSAGAAGASSGGGASR